MFRITTLLLVRLRGKIRCYNGINHLASALFYSDTGSGEQHASSARLPHAIIDVISIVLPVRYLPNARAWSASAERHLWPGATAVKHR